MYLVSGTLTPDEATAKLTAWDLHPVGAVQSYSAKHVFTHIEWHMRVYAMDVAGEGTGQFVRSDGSRSIPTAFAVCLRRETNA